MRREIESELSWYQPRKLRIQFLEAMLPTSNPVFSEAGLQELTRLKKWVELVDAALNTLGEPQREIITQYLIMRRAARMDVLAENLHLSRRDAYRKLEQALVYLHGALMGSRTPNQ